MLTPKLFASSAAQRAVAPAAAVLLAVLAVLAACGGSQGAAPGAGRSTAASPSAVASPAAETALTPAPAGSAAAKPITAADLDRVAHQIYVGDQHPTDCNWNNRSVCPVTDRLAARLTELALPPKNGPGQVSLFCRCQNQADSWQVSSETTAGGGVAHVTLNYSPTLHVRIDLMVVDGGGRALVDDTRCTDRGADTSLYASTLAGCG
jgi:hypothetical protein